MHDLVDLADVTGLPPLTLAEVVARAGSPTFERWTHQVASCGYCARPVRLRGRVTVDGREVFSTANEPDGVLMKACGNRRASVCPSCSYTYAGDMWQLLYGGIVGGRKGVPDTVTHHPKLFVTLTAPIFGIVHGNRNGARCRPRREGTLCAHGRPTWCMKTHQKDDPAVGQPLCPDCYDYEAAVLFNWWAPELWRRFRINLSRALAARLGLTERHLREGVRLSYGKVA